MPDTRAAHQRIDRYLQDLRRALGGLPEEHVADIVEELRSHLLEKATAGGELTAESVASALEGLGDPEELASQYLTDHLLARAQFSHSPLLVLRGLFQTATLGLAGIFVLVGSGVGYGLCLAVVLCAALKVFHPASAGLWAGPEGELSLRMGFGAPPAGTRELLGWWIIPIGLALGAGLYLLTIRFGRWGVRTLRHAGRAEKP